MENEIYQWLLWLSRAAQIGSFGGGILGCVTSAFLCFPLWHRTRLRFFAFYGSASLISLFCYVTNETLLQTLATDGADYLLLYSLTLILGTLANVLALIGTVQLARYFRERFPGPVPPEPAPGSVGEQAE